MKPTDYIEASRLNEVAFCGQVPAAGELLNAARKKRDELIAQAARQAGRQDPEVETLLIKAQGLDWIISLPEKAKTMLNSIEEQS